MNDMHGGDPRETWLKEVEAVSKSPANDAGAPLPFFVYGTLRLGQVNWTRLLRGRTVAARRAVLRDHRMWDVGIPYVSDCEGSTVAGDLIEVRRECYEAVLTDLDRLEGHVPGSPGRSHYVRVVRSVDVPADGARHAERAWVYRAGPAACARLSLNDEAIVTNGDWLDQDAGSSPDL